ncbi:MAG: Hint domain-containing protein, partial [Pseudomonadota bacterium]
VARACINRVAANDLVFGQDDSDTIIGGEGDDTLDGGTDDDRISGGDGDDSIIGGQGADQLAGGADADRFTATQVSDFFGDTIDGGTTTTTGADDDKLDLRGLGDYRVVGETTDADGDSTSGTIEFLNAGGAVTGSLTFREIERIICFTPGAQIMTAKGEMPVEMLRPGDRVMTRDDGFQEVAWLGRRDLTAGQVLHAPKLRPILIRKGALGHDLPLRDMWVSPNHRMLETGAAVQMLMGETEVLTAAKHMIGRAGIHQARPRATSYIHMMFDRHQIVMADGAWTESFYPGSEALDAVDADQRAELFTLFPALQTQGTAGYAAARRALRRYEVHALAEALG